jgi:hypothetical protein
VGDGCRAPTLKPCRAGFDQFAEARQPAVDIGGLALELPQRAKMQARDLWASPRLPFKVSALVAAALAVAKTSCGGSNPYYRRPDNA